MEEKNFYEGIFKRKSIRKYDLEPIDEKTLGDISSYMDRVKPMYQDIKVKMKIVTQEVVKNLLPIKAPYYILLYSEEKEGYLRNAGFMLQQLDLFLSHNGLGSCWVGMAKPKKEITGEAGLKYVIALAFGSPAEALHRESVAEFKRKSIEEIREGDGKDQLIEAARLAPSATNSQPWFFKISGDNIHAFCIKLNFIKAIIYEKMNQIDMGIAICHLWISAKHFEKDLEFRIDKQAAKEALKDYYYTMTIKIK